MNDGVLLKVVAMCCITLLEITNLVVFGYDSGILVTVVSVLCGLAGYQVGKATGEMTQRKRKRK